VSYAFYAIHQPILHSFGAGAAVALAPRLGYDGAVAVVVAAALCLCLTLAAFITAGVDRPSNRITKRLISRLIRSRSGAIVDHGMTC